MTVNMIEFLVENKSDGKIYEISELVTEVSYTESLNDGCSKLEFGYIDDSLRLANGAVVRFKYDRTNIFYGYVFKSKKGKGKEIQITAYDQLMYLKAKDTIAIKDMTLGDLVKKACSYFNLKVGAMANTKYKLPVSVQDNKTWLDMLYDGVSDTLLGNEKKYAIRDEFGQVTLRDLEDLKLDLVLGDESLCYDFDYEKSIDGNTYNMIKLMKDNESTGGVDVYITKDSNAFTKWGILQYFEKVDKGLNDAQVKSKADALLKLYNREEESLELSCLGDVSVRAGTSIVATIEDIQLDKRLIVDKVTHEFLPVHTMDLELIL